MLSPTSPLYPVLHLLADALDPLLALVALLHPAMRPPLGDRRRVRSYYLATILGIVGIYAVAGVDVVFSVWGRHGLDYSTHTAFAVSLAISIGLARPRWAWALGITLVANAVLIVVLGFHSATEVVTSGVVAVLVTLPWALALGRRG